jgi:4-diphosphocytidyl-2-C-methyl-D-erythritol kinase
MLFFPNGKINLGLHILQKRPDGYHNLESVFYPTGWTDVLEAIPASSLQFSSSGLPIPGDLQENLCLKAYQLLNAQHPLPPMHIHLHKVIPIGAGLGGGSADGAFMLRLLNVRFELGLNTAQLEEHARKLGSDCAFFIENQPRYCFEKGDQFEAFSLDLKGHYIGLVYPNLAISTATAYRGVVPQTPEIPLKEVLVQPISTWKEQLRNDFEASLFPLYPLLDKVKNALYQAGAVYAAMSGSGSTLFGLFEKPPHLGQLFPDYLTWEGML